MKRVCFLFWIISFTASLFAQKEIKGRVLDSQYKRPMEAVTVTLHPKEAETILSYTMTAKDGTFTLKCKQMPDSVRVMVRAMTVEGYATTVRSDISFLEIEVKEKQTKLKEVIVKAPKIRQRGDTLDFSVASFIDETDRSIGDVLKKLPGIQVLSSGQILYQNKPVSKFYVEGMDLLKGKYGLATKNVEAKQVATVQVLENHQPIKVLKDMELPESAAINLKLKESALGAFFLTAQAGVGIPDVLLSNELVGMRFARNLQNMLVYKGDNTGRDIAKELTTFYDYLGTHLIQFLSIEAPSQPSINGQHYLFNEAHMVSFNDLRKTKRDLTLTSNVNYLVDDQTSNSFSKRTVFVEQSEPIHIIEDLNAQMAKRELEGSFTLEGNTDEYFLENRLRAISKWNEHTGNVLTSNNISQLLNQPSFQIENDFSYVKRISDKRFRVGSKISYTKQNRSLTVAPILFDEFIPTVNPQDSILKQTVSFDYLDANLYYSKGKDLNHFYVNYKAEAFTKLYNLNSNLTVGDNIAPITIDSLQNDFKRNEVGGACECRITYRTKKRGQLSLALPLRYMHLNRKDALKDTDKGSHYLFFNPAINYRLPLSTRIDLHSDISYTNNIGAVQEDYLGYIMTTYRSLRKNDGQISKNRNLNVSANLSYKNPFTTLFTNFRISYSNSWNNMLYDVRYNGILNNSISFLHPNRSHFYRATISLGKSMDAISSEVKIHTSYTLNKSLTMNQGVISDYQSKSFTITPSINTEIGRIMIVNYNASYRNSKNEVKGLSFKPIHYFSQKIKTSFIPIKKLIFNVSVNHYYNSLIDSGSRSSWFGNVGIKYQMKRVAWMLDWTNVFNTNKFITYAYSATSSFYSEYMLRPSELLLRVRFKVL